jgi:hypothetical protein
MSNNEMREIQAQQYEISRKLTEKISDDLSKFQKTMEDIFKQTRIFHSENQRRTGTCRPKYKIR